MNRQNVYTVGFYSPNYAWVEPETTNQITILNTEITNIEQNITNIEQNITNIEQNITNIEQNVTNIEQNITNIEQNITNIEQNITTIEGDITNINTTVNEIIEQIDNDIGRYIYLNKDNEDADSDGGLVINVSTTGVFNVMEILNANTIKLEEKIGLLPGDFIGISGTKKNNGVYEVLVLNPFPLDEDHGELILNDSPVYEWSKEGLDLDEEDLLEKIVIKKIRVTVIRGTNDDDDRIEMGQGANAFTINMHTIAYDTYSPEFKRVELTASDDQITLGNVTVSAEGANEVTHKIPVVETNDNFVLEDAEQELKNKEITDESNVVYARGLWFGGNDPGVVRVDGDGAPTEGDVLRATGANSAKWQQIIEKIKVEGDGLTLNGNENAEATSGEITLKYNPPAKIDKIKVAGKLKLNGAENAEASSGEITISYTPDENEEDEEDLEEKFNDKELPGGEGKGTPELNPTMPGGGPGSGLSVPGFDGLSTVMSVLGGLAAGTVSGAAVAAGAMYTNAIGSVGAGAASGGGLGALTGASGNVGSPLNNPGGSTLDIAHETAKMNSAATNTLKPNPDGPGGSNSGGDDKLDIKHETVKLKSIEEGTPGDGIVIKSPLVPAEGGSLGTPEQPFENIYVTNLNVASGGDSAITFKGELNVVSDEFTLTFFPIDPAQVANYDFDLSVSLLDGKVTIKFPEVDIGAICDTFSAAVYLKSTTPIPAKYRPDADIYFDIVPIWFHDELTDKNYALHNLSARFNIRVDKDGFIHFPAEGAEVYTNFLNADDYYVGFPMIFPAQSFSWYINTSLTPTRLFLGIPDVPFIKYTPLDFDVEIFQFDEEDNEELINSFPLTIYRAQILGNSFLLMPELDIFELIEPHRIQHEGSSVFSIEFKGYHKIDLYPVLGKYELYAGPNPLYLNVGHTSMIIDSFSDSYLAPDLKIYRQYVGGSPNLIDASSPQTVSNKTLANCTLDGDSFIGENSIDDIVFTDANQTLSNKTLSNPTITGNLNGTAIGNYVTTTGTQTLSNKTLTNPTISGFLNGTAIGNYVTTSATQTLTSKTLVNPVITGGFFGEISINAETTGWQTFNFEHGTNTPIPLNLKFTRFMGVVFVQSDSNTHSITFPSAPGSATNIAMHNIPLGFGTSVRATHPANVINGNPSSSDPPTGSVNVLSSTIAFYLGPGSTNFKNVAGNGIYRFAFHYFQS